MDCRICFTLNDVQVFAFACECGTCKNFFFMPRSELSIQSGSIEIDNPKFCPHCGRQFNPEKINHGVDLSDAMRAVLFNSGDGDTNSGA